MTIDNIIEDFKSKPMSRRNFLKTLTAGALALTFGLLVKESHAEDEWAKLKLYERETNEIVNEDGINFKIYIRGYSLSDKKYRVKYMLDSEKYVDRVFWGDWYYKRLEKHNVIIMIYDPNIFYTRENWDFIRQEKIYQLFAKDYVDKKLNANFDLYEINMDKWNDDQKLKLAKIVGDYQRGAGRTVMEPSLIFTTGEVYAAIRAPAINIEDGKNLINKIFLSYIKR